ncbi:hypothetical protein KC926_03395 [Candidatus Kaiserbacteria bacterium]|nr:hypothetical protein [Candidatus Kaiserbacteria bacterium]
MFDERNEFGESLLVIRIQGLLIFFLGKAQENVSLYMSKTSLLMMEIYTEDVFSSFLHLIWDLVSLIVLLMAVANIVYGIAWIFFPKWNPSTRWKIVRQKK